MSDLHRITWLNQGEGAMAMVGEPLIPFSCIQEREKALMTLWKKNLWRQTYYELYMVPGGVMHEIFIPNFQKRVRIFCNCTRGRFTNMMSW
ncbi:MAG: hypothetical protein IPH18_12620 [Chitinophagaceae bacterium]|nr:hypothetical protein [Chitinophagaceae bacterium]